MNKPHPSSLQRIVGVGFGLAIVVGGTLGPGILRMPATIAGYTSNPYFFIACWILGGLVALMGASIYAELGTRLPIAGGPFVFAKKAFGGACGFVTGCSDWLFMSSSMSYMAIAMAEYLNRLMQWNLPVGVSGSGLIMLFAMMQWQGLKSSSKFQEVLTVTNACCLLLFVATCFVYFFRGNSYTGVIPGSKESLPFLPMLILSIRAVYIAYTGWNSAVYFNEEDKDPQANLPRSLILGVVGVMIIYVVINLGLLAVLPLPVIANSNWPVADAAQLIFGGNGGSVVTIISIISIASCLSATMLIGSRILFSVSRAGLFFKWFAMLNQHSIPGNSLLMTASVAIIFSLSGIFNVVVSMAALFALLADLSVYVAIFFFRRQDSSVSGYYKAWAYPYGPICMILITLALMLGVFMEDTIHGLYAVATLAIAFPFYFIFRSKSKGSQYANH